MKHTRFMLAVLIAGLIGMGVSHAQATKLVVTTPAGGAYAGAVFTTQPIVEAQDASNVTDPAFSGPVTIKIKTGTDATGGVVLGTTTVNAVNGVAAFTDLSINQVGNFTIEASSGSLAVADSLVPVMVNLAEVWGKQLPATGTATSLGGDQSIRSFAVNKNPGSPWAGTTYIPRRNTPTGAIFYFKATATNPSAAPGSGTLQTAGPDYANPDGIFVNPSGVTSWVTIGVAEDDYVYACPGFTGNLWRFNPDGTNGTQVISGFGSGALVRQMFVTGKGIATTIWYVNGSKNVEKWVASVVDGSNAPTAFTKSTLFAVTETASQLHQSTLNSNKDAFYYVYFGGVSPVKYSIAGTKDTAFPLYTLSNAMGIAMDSMDRLLIESYTHSLVAMSPANGNNLLAGAGAQGNDGSFQPTGMPNIDFANSFYIELQRYSDRHYFWFACGASGTNPTSYNGVISTDVPAPDAKDVVVVNPGTGTSLDVTFTLGADPELIGANIYRSTAAGVLGAKVNTSAAASPFSDSGLASGTPYFYTVRPVGKDPFTGAEYESANLAQVSGVPVLVLPPDAPTGISATDTQLGGEVTVAWTTPALYADAINIYRSTTAGQLGSKVKVVSSPTPSAPASWLDTGLANGVPVYYTVKAMNGKGEESPNTDQVSATPTDSTAPTFTGLKTVHDYGYPGFRLAWDPALDNSTPVTYNVYAGASAGTVDYAHSIGSTTLNAFDLRGLTVGQDVFIAVRATDAAGNVDPNIKVVGATPTRVIVDSDVNANVNYDKVNFQPDPAFPALIPVGLGSLKGSAPDLFEGGFQAGILSYQTNDVKGKVSYTIPINAAGKYTISAFWAPLSAINTPGYIYHITLPGGAVLPDIVIDQLGINADPAGPAGSKWNLLTTQNLTPGNLVIVGDASASSSSDSAAWNVSGAVRALLAVGPTQVPIYKASAAPTIDGSITDPEWKAYPPIYLGKAWQDVIGGNWTGPADYQSTVKVKWDSNALYLAVKAVDDVLALPTVSTDVPLNIWNNDGFEVYLGLDPAWASHAAPYITGDYQVVMSATTDNGTTGQPYVGAYYSELADFGLTQPTVAFVKTTLGYNMEAAIPWQVFGAYPSAPAADQIIGFNLHGNDNDNPSTKEQDSAFSLSGLPGSATNPSAWITAKILAGSPPSAVKADLNGDGIFDSNDVKLALQIAAGLLTGTQQSLDAGDVYPAGAPDGKIDLLDATRLDRALNGKDTL